MCAAHDVMGDLHNLFRDVSEIHIFLDPEETGGYYVEEVIEGSNIAPALDAVQHDGQGLKRRMKAQIDAANTGARLRAWAGMRMSEEHERGPRDHSRLTF